MKKTGLKLLLLTAVLLIGVLAITSCSGKSEFEPPYDGFNEAGATVSVKYDANGGQFTSGVYVIKDSYKPSKLRQNEDGMLILPLISPDDTRRGEANTFTVTAGSVDYSFAGWYTTRTAVTDEDGNLLDHFGEPISVSGRLPAYRYENKWDFDNMTYLIDPDVKYNNNNPVLTLYAAWVPRFSVELYERESGTSLGTYFFNAVNNGFEITLPSWDNQGNLVYNDLSTIGDSSIAKSNTYDSIYLDRDGLLPLLTSTVTHSAATDIDEVVATGYLSGNNMSLYVDFLDGLWTRIYTAEQFIKKASVSGNFIIMDDLDFADTNYGKNAWQTTGFHEKEFNGKIIGNGHTFYNVSATQTKQGSAGLFYKIGASAVISDLQLEGASFQVLTGSRTPAYFGLLAGTIDENADISELTITNSTLYIKPGILLPTAYNFGLVAGGGYYADIDYSSISYEVMDSNTHVVEVTQSGQTLIVTQRTKTADDE